MSAAAVLASVDPSQQIEHVQQRAIELYKVFRESDGTAKELGEALLTIKKTLPPRKFVPWLKSAGIDRNHASYAMRVFTGKNRQAKVKAKAKPKVVLLKVGMLVTDGVGTYRVRHVDTTRGSIILGVGQVETEPTPEPVPVEEPEPAPVVAAANQVVFPVAELKHACTQLKAVVAKKSSEALYYYVRVFTDGGVVNVQGIDIDSTLTLKLLTATAGGAVNFLIRFETLQQVVKNLDASTATFTLSEGEALVETLDFCRRLKTIPPDKFTELPLVKGITAKPDTGYTFPLPALKEQYGLIDFAVPEAGGRHVITSALLEVTDDSVMNVAGTNGAVLPLVTTAAPEKMSAFSYSIPKQALELVKQMTGDSVTISDTEGAYFFETATELVTYNKTHAQFPNYRKIVPQSAGYPTTVKFNDKAVTLAAFERSKVAALAVAVPDCEEKNAAAVLNADGAVATLTTHEVEYASRKAGDAYETYVAAVRETSHSTAPIECVGGPAHVRVDASKLLPFLNRATFPVTLYVKDEVAVLDWHGAGSTPEKPTYRFLIMPCRPLKQPEPTTDATEGGEALYNKYFRPTPKLLTEGATV